MFHYFEALLAAQDSFGTSIANQSVLTVSLSRAGPTPWTTVDFSWNIQWQWPKDIKAGYAVLHKNWWAPTHWESKDYFLSLVLANDWLLFCFWLMIHVKFEDMRVLYFNPLLLGFVYSETVEMRRTDWLLLA